MAMENGLTWLYWQRKAVDEIKTKLIDHWNDDKKTFVKLSLENKALGNLELDIYDSLETEISDQELFHNVFVLWQTDPIIHRVMFHNAIPAEDIKPRSLFRDKYLPDEYLEYYIKQLNFESVLEDSELAKIQKVKGLPVHLFMVGEALGTFLTHYQHFCMIDKVKEAGAASDIEELREKRVRVDDEVVVFDYSPLYKSTLGKGFLSREFFNKDDFLQYKKKYLNIVKSDIDDLLYLLIHKTVNDQQKRRLNNFEGNLKITPKTYYVESIEKYKYILKYKNEEIIIPLQILPKYLGLIIKPSEHVPKDERPDIIQDQVELFLQAVRDQNPNKLKPKGLPVASFLKNQMLWRSKEKWEKESIQVKGNRISDNPLDDSVKFGAEDEEKKIYIDNLKDEDGLDPESAIINDEDMAMFQYARNNIRLMDICERKANKLPLSSKDQKYFERKIKDIRIQFKLQKIIQWEDLPMQDHEKEYSILKVAKNGLTVKLNDGSRWEISVGDSTKTSCWYETMHIQITEDSEDTQYSFRLTNLNTSTPDVVRARKK